MKEAVKKHKLKIVSAPMLVASNVVKARSWCMFGGTFRLIDPLK